MPRRAALATPLALLAFGFAASCADIPDLDTPAMRAGGEYPALLPLDFVFGEASAPRAGGEETASTPARTARLRARAQALRAPVIAPELRARMLAALARAGG
ncbi:hypothetical protein C2I36_12470 [Rhodobacteraceae bacterium WD3A24]|nr:hypothetical protein C2I36_12470 [Rhodobacteraceae bacterium WD3A24]